MAKVGNIVDPASIIFSLDDKPARKRPPVTFGQGDTPTRGFSQADAPAPRQITFGFNDRPIGERQTPDRNPITELAKRFGTNIANAFKQVGQSIISSPFSPIGIPQKEASRFKGQARNELDQAGFTGSRSQAEQLIRQRSSELAAAQRLPKVELDPAQGFAEKAVDVGAGLATFVAQLAITRKVLPAGTPEAVVWEVQNQLSGGVPGQGMAMRVTLGQIGKFPTGTPLGKIGKVGAESTLFAGITAATGGNAEDIIVSALIPIAFNTWSFAKQTSHLKSFERDLRTEAIGAHQQRMKQGMAEGTSAAHLKADMRGINITVSKAKQRIFHDDAFAPAKEKWETERQKALKLVASGKPNDVKRGNAILDFIENVPSLSEKATTIEPGKRTTISIDASAQQRQAVSRGITTAERNQANTRIRRVLGGIQPTAQAPGVAPFLSRTGRVQSQSEFEAEFDIPEQAEVTPEKRTEAINGIKKLLASEQFQSLSEEDRIAIGQKMLKQFGVEAEAGELVEGRIEERVKKQGFEGEKGEKVEDLTVDAGAVELSDKIGSSLTKAGFTEAERGQGLIFGGFGFQTFVSGDGNVKIAVDNAPIFVHKGDVRLGNTNDRVPNELTIQGLVVEPGSRGQGLAKKAMQELQDAADENGITLVGEPVKMKDFVKKGQKSLSTEGLVAWYKKLGWTQQTKGSNLILEYKPKAPDLPGQQVIPRAAAPAINVYKTTDGEITGLQEQDVELREGVLVDKDSGKPVILDQEASGSALARPAPAAEVKKPSPRLPREPRMLGEDVTGILGGVPAQEAAGLTRAEIQHLDPRQQRALRAAQKRGLKVGFKQGVAETITDARRTMAALITKRDINEKNKMDLASIVLTYVPKRDQGRFIRRILDLKTPKASRQLAALVREAAEGLIERRAVREAKKALAEQISRIPRFGRRIKLRAAAVNKIKAALEELPEKEIAELAAGELAQGRRLDPVSLQKLSKAKKAELEAVRDQLKEIGFKIEQGFTVPDPDELAGIEAIVGERVIAQLRRLQTDSIARMTSEEINSIADAIRYALDQDSKETKERTSERARQRRAERTEARVEVTMTKAAGKIDTEERGIPISMPKRVYNFLFQDSLHRWALIESATSNVETTTARVLDLDIHEGKTKKLGKEFEALEFLWSEMDRIGWSQSDIDRVDEVHSVKLGGKTYKLTTQEIMSLGMNAKSERNAKQIVQAEDLFIAGREVKTPTMGEIVDAMDVLSDKEIAIMDFLPTLNEEILMPAINEVSEDMLGLILAIDPHYWGLKRKLGKTVRGRTTAGPAIEDLGAFQPFLGSKITLRILPFWGQLLTQIQNASSLHGMAQPMEAARSLLNDSKGPASWQKNMDRLGRRREKENLLTIFERTQGVASDRDNIDIVGSTLLAHSAKAILGWRVSTMAVQSASIPMAFTIIPDKYSVSLPGLAVQRGAEQSNRINEFSPFLRMRHIGGRTSIVTGDAAAANAVDTLIFRTPGDKSLEGMRRVDRFAIEFIDRAVQRWVADTTQLEVGSREYWEEVARRTDDVVRKTQPMWDVDERSILGSSPGFLKRSLFIFRSAREAVYNQNLMAVDRYLKTRNKSAAKKELANTFAMTTISTLMVVGIGLALRKSIAALFAIITGRKAPDEDKATKEKVVGFLADVVETSVEYAPLGRLAVGLGNLALRTGRWSDLDPDAIAYGGPVAVAKGAGHLTEAYEAYFEDGDQAKLKKELVGAFNDIVDGVARIKGIPVGGILQLTTQPLERALREKEKKKGFRDVGNPFN